MDWNKLQMLSRFKILFFLKFEEVNRKLRDSEHKIREFERRGTNQAEYDVNLAEVQNELEEKFDQIVASPDISIK